MKLIKTLLAGVAVAAVAMPALADTKKAEVLHWWTSSGEAAAIKQFAEAYNAAGGEWIDSGVGGTDMAKSMLTNRLMGGNPPQVGQFNTSREFEELIDAGVLNNIDAEAEAGNWGELFPPIIDNLVKRNGHYYALPVNIHGSNWLWYNIDLLEQAGVEPPSDWDSFFAAAEKLQEAGIVPLALGGQAWQERLTFNAVLLTIGGQDLYLRLFQDRDLSALESDEMKQVVSTYTRLRDLVRATDSGSPGRSWNDATNMVISGKAAMQIMGDWAKGEFIAAEKEIGKDYGCVPAVLPGSTYMISGDVFVFPKTGSDADREAQSLMATTMLDPKVQVAFNNVKGSVPVRPDVDASQMDACGQQAIKLTSDAKVHVGSTSMYISPDLAGALQDIYTEYWNSEGMSEEDVLSLMNSAFKSID
ncbi:ABC transporter substrate-binding protein [Labrenzia sp. VG12]|uniref:ABC transporter substrate-binding protein n=1 Tax=Labrenzia sp. VG12 TaxID=2021862 RepID=UPI000B8C3C49|nr:ABC transporter substrate-binding protein [Labrenzia sp. VG12]ASP36829.1 sugar ABC transporter substrate-binding protein [Labrenzia sp. VG12]